MKHLIFSSVIVIILILINPGLTYSNSQPARFSSGLGIHNLMQNGETRCTKPQSDQTCFTSDLKDIDSSSFVFSLEYYTKKKIAWIFTTVIWLFRDSRKCAFWLFWFEYGLFFC